MILSLNVLSSRQLQTFKVNNRNTRTRREICSKLTIKTPESNLLQALICDSGRPWDNLKPKLGCPELYLLQNFMIKLILRKFPATFCPLVERLGTSQDMNGK